MGDYAKIGIFKEVDETTSAPGERFWIKVTWISHDGIYISGTVSNDLLFYPELDDTNVTVRMDHVLSIMIADDADDDADDEEINPLDGYRAAYRVGIAALETVLEDCEGVVDLFIRDKIDVMERLKAGEMTEEDVVAEAMGIILKGQVKQHGGLN